MWLVKASSPKEYFLAFFGIPDKMGHTKFSQLCSVLTTSDGSMAVFEAHLLSTYLEQK